MPTRDEIIQGCIKKIDIELKLMGEAFPSDDDSLEIKVKKVFAKEKEEEAMNNAD